MADGTIPIYNYQGYKVVYSHSAECPKEYSAKGMKYHPVFDNLHSYTAAIQKLKKVRAEVEAIWSGRYFEYSSYILEISPHEYELTFKCYINP